MVNLRPTVESFRNRSCLQEGYALAVLLRSRHWHNPVDLDRDAGATCCAQLTETIPGGAT